MKKILILVQACDDAPYFEMQKAQQKTWDSIDVPETITYYYYGNDKHRGKYILNGKKLYCPCSEVYDMMHYRYKMATEFLLNLEWDLMFRTNASSYIDKKMLLDYAQQLPVEKCFVSMGNFVMSGCGFFLSRDLIKIANEGIDEHPTPSEDMYIATMLNRAGYDLIEGGDRVDYNHYSETQRPCYHYRCKSDTSDRNKDITAFNKLFAR